MRKINTLLVIIASIFFFFTPFQSASANEFLSGYTLSGFECGEPVITDKLDDSMNHFIENDANMAEKFLAQQTQNLFNIGDINSLASLIYGNPYCIWADADEEEATMSANGIFTNEEMNKIIKPMVSLLGSIFVIMLTIAFLIQGLKIMTNSVKGRAWADFWNDFGWMILAVFLGVFYYEFINIFFQLNAALVLSIRDLTNSLDEDSLKGFSVMSSLTDFLNVGAFGSFLIVIIAEWIVAGILNIIYIARKVIILLLIVLGVIALYSLLFAKTRAFFGTWLKELIGNVFLQSIHALVLFGVIQFVELGAGVFFKVVLMCMFIPVSGMISKWLNFGDSSSSIGSALTMVGLGGAMSTMMLANQASNVIRGGAVNNGAFSPFPGGNGGGGGGNGGGLTQLANSVANDTSATSIAMRAQGNSDSTVFNAIKGAGENLGQFVGGGAGVVAGPAGAALMSRVGGAVGGGVPQVARNLAVGASSLKDSIAAMKNYASENGSNGFKALFGKSSTQSFDDLNSRRQLMANAGESLGVMLGGQKGASMGRSLGAALSGASRSRLNELNTHDVSQALGLGQMNGALSFDQLAQKFPDAESKWVQTNQGSSFHVNTGNGFTQVGVTGAADGTLKDGQARVMDFKLADTALNYSLQPNGTYKPNETIASSVGLQGSTPHVMRTSDAYIVSNVNHYNAREVATVSSSGATPKIQDSQFQAKNINPDAYIYQGVAGSQVSSSDRVANNVKTTGVVASKWASKISKGFTKRKSKAV